VSGWSEDVDELRYDELNNEVDREDLSDSDLSSSDGGDFQEDSRTALDGEGPTLAADDDFATAVARAAQLAGLTVVGTTVTDSDKGLTLIVIFLYLY